MTITTTEANKNTFVSSQDDRGQDTKMIDAIRDVVDQCQMSDSDHDAILRAWDCLAGHVPLPCNNVTALKFARALVIAALGVEGLKKLGINNVRQMESYKPILLAAGKTEAEYMALYHHMKAEKAARWTANRIKTIAVIAGTIASDIGLPPCIGSQVEELIARPGIMTGLGNSNNGYLARAALYHVAATSHVVTPAVMNVLGLSPKRYSWFLHLAGLPAPSHRARDGNEVLDLAIEIARQVHDDPRIPAITAAVQHKIRHHIQSFKTRNQAAVIAMVVLSATWPGRVSLPFVADAARTRSATVHNAISRLLINAGVPSRGVTVGKMNLAAALGITKPEPKTTSTACSAVLPGMERLFFMA